jgi:NTP pyrophosphatase (non-canonical NTP hydrolase)
MFPVVSTITMQQEVAEWNDRQPWADDPPELVTLGAAEEVGELCRASLKLKQGIRGTPEEWLDEIKKETGDVFIKLCAIADAYGFDLAVAITQRWMTVRERDWKANPIGHGIDKEA